MQEQGLTHYHNLLHKEDSLPSASWSLVAVNIMEIFPNFSELDKTPNQSLNSTETLEFTALEHMLFHHHVENEQ